MDRLAQCPLHAEPTSWPGTTVPGSVVIPLRSDLLSALPDVLAMIGAPASAGGAVFRRKNEFHLTLLSSTHSKTIAEGCAQPMAADLLRQLDWRIRADGRYWLVRDASAEPAAHTIIATLDAPALAVFRQQLGLEPPVPHVTLYSSEKPGGIGIAGPAQWAERVIAPLAIDWDRCRARVVRADPTDATIDG